MEKIVTIPRISCVHCIKTIKNELGKIGGVKSVDGDPQTKKIKVVWESPADWQKISETLEEIGYPPED
jgi:copper chaperone CopZ